MPGLKDMFIMVVTKCVMSCAPFLSSHVGMWSPSQDFTSDYFIISTLISVSVARNHVNL